MAIIVNRILNYFIFSLGVLFVILGIIGAVLPIMPTTPFLILASWCFMKSSPRAHQWLHRQPLVGPALRDWENHRVISRKAKTIAITMITFSTVILWFRIPILWVNLLSTVVLTSVSIFLAAQKEEPPKTFQKSVKSV